MNPVFLSAEWRKLAIANYEIDPSLLSRYLPYGTEIDLWKSKCYVSLVGFRFVKTKLKGIPIPFHTNFEEINLRFYVRHKDNGVWRRGVTFVKEIVPKAALTIVANTFYKEKYITLPTKHEWTDDSNSQNVKYAWKHFGDWDSIAVSASATAESFAAGSEEEFITEHYWGYTQINKNKASQYQVEHPSWQTYQIADYEINVRFGKLYGEEFGVLEQIEPDSVMLAEGSKVFVRSANPIQQNLQA